MVAREERCISMNSHGRKECYKNCRSEFLVTSSLVKFLALISLDSQGAKRCMFFYLIGRERSNLNISGFK